MENMKYVVSIVYNHNNELGNTVKLFYEESKAKEFLRKQYELEKDGFDLEGDFYSSNEDMFDITYNDSEIWGSIYNIID